MGDLKKRNPGRRSTDVVTDLVIRMEKAEQWYAKHDAECADRYGRIESTTGRIERKLDAQDSVLAQQNEDLSIIRKGKSWIGIGWKGAAGLVAVAAAWSTVMEVVQYFLSHWH